MQKLQLTNDMWVTLKKGDILYRLGNCGIHELLIEFDTLITPDAWGGTLIKNGCKESLNCHIPDPLEVGSYWDGMTKVNWYFLTEEKIIYRKSRFENIDD